MPKIYPFIPDPEGQLNWRVGTDENLDFSRVPCVGEYISLGNDTAGIHAVYQVVAVIHAAGRPNDTDAEVYLRRVEFLDVQKSLANKPVPFEIESKLFPKRWKGGVQVDSDALDNLDPNTLLHTGIQHRDVHLMRQALSRFRELDITEGTANAATALAVAGDAEGAETLRALLFSRKSAALTRHQKRTAVAGLAQYYLMQYKAEEGLQRLEQLLQRLASDSTTTKEDAAFFLNQLGRLYYSAGRLDAALQAQSEAAKLNPEELAYTYNLSLVYQELGKLDEAAVAAKTLLRGENSDFRDPDHFAHAVELFVQVGDDREAKAAYSRLREIDPVRADAVLRSNRKLRKIIGT